MKLFFYNFFENVVRIFSGKNVLWHVLAIVLTAGIVWSGFDWWYFLATQNSTLQVFVLPALALGGLLPILFPVGLWSIGTYKKNTHMRLAGFAVGQAALVGSLVSSTYKFFTGRIQPDQMHLLLDTSRHFQFGFFKHGIFWGWPSSHTTIAFAMAFALVCVSVENKALRIGAFVYAFYIGFGVSTNIHWFSDFVAGAIIGSVIGHVVGTSFKAKFNRIS